jgi:flagellar motor component MotA
MRFTVCVVVILVTLVGAVMLDGGNPVAYVGIPGLVIEVLVPLFALLAVWKGSELRAACRDAFASPKTQSSPTRSLRVWDFAEKACYAAGALAWLMAMVLTLVSQVPPRDSTHLMRNLAVCLVAPIYAIFFALVCRILRERVKHQSGD